MLLTHEEIQQGYGALYRGELRERYRLPSPGLCEARTKELEAGLGAALPPVFRGAIQHFNMNGRDMGPVGFGSVRFADYAEGLLHFNSDDRHPDWNRPLNIIAFAVTDGFTFILDMETDAISCVEDGQPRNSMEVVARNMDLFLRANGTIDIIRENRTEPLGDKAEIAQAIAAEAGGEEGIRYWREVARCWD